MAASEWNNFIPRPVPKPTQLEPTLNSSPEVPEVSLVIDPSANQISHFQHNHRYSIDTTNDQFQLKNGNNSNSLPAVDLHKFSNYSTLPKSSCSLNKTNPFNGYQNIKPSISTRVIENELLDVDQLARTHNSPQSSTMSFRKKPDMPNLTRKVTFSQHPTLLTEYLGQSLNTPQENIYTDSADIDRYLFPENYSSPHKTASVNNGQCQRLYQNNVENNRCSRSKCLCTHSCGLQKDDTKVYVTEEELQKMNLKFENTLLKLNFKFSKLMDNFVSKEELKSITKKYSEQIGILNQQILDLRATLDAESSPPSRSVMYCDRAGISERNQTKIPTTRSINCESEENTNLVAKRTRNVSNQLLLQRSQQESEFNIASAGSLFNVSKGQINNRTSGACIDSNPSQEVMNDMCESQSKSSSSSVDCDLMNPDHHNLPKEFCGSQLASPRFIAGTEQQRSYSNGVMASDLSSHMSAIAAKYLHNNDSSKKGQVETEANENAVDVGGTHCNVSIATREYLERYQLLTSNKPLDNDSRYIDNQPQFVQKPPRTFSKTDNNVSFIG